MSYVYHTYPLQLLHNIFTNVFDLLLSKFFFKCFFFKYFLPYAKFFVRHCLFWWKHLYGKTTLFWKTEIRGLKEPCDSCVMLLMHLGFIGGECILDRCWIWKLEYSTVRNCNIINLLFNATQRHVEQHYGYWHQRQFTP